MNLCKENLYSNKTRIKKQRPKQARTAIKYLKQLRATLWFKWQISPIFMHKVGNSDATFFFEFRNTTKVFKDTREVKIL